ncbi:hypothetical protein K504DRAFT_252530 [Pleomassaria siparia CBS 279.74]|uniref:Uncharacterized protein n=1 Tax=Pleomassaria siparia CBS 279.74 TaxID=1314801 RepID=A0A6G1KBJ9_9PLEO|nr:hypothetical protein K504DRAFT_252530 [Pleomassaria siparia CBS 279.74]
MRTVPGFGDFQLNPVIEVPDFSLSEIFRPAEEQKRMFEAQLAEEARRDYEYRGTLYSMLIDDAATLDSEQRAFDTTELSVPQRIEHLRQIREHQQARWLDSGVRELSKTPRYPSLCPAAHWKNGDVETARRFTDAGIDVRASLVTEEEQANYEEFLKLNHPSPSVSPTVPSPTAVVPAVNPPTTTSTTIPTTAPTAIDPGDTIRLI